MLQPDEAGQSAPTIATDLQRIPETSRQYGQEEYRPRGGGKIDEPEGFCRFSGWRGSIAVSCWWRTGGSCRNPGRVTQVRRTSSIDSLGCGGPDRRSSLLLPWF